jgi:hypothetical protein
MPERVLYAPERNPWPWARSQRSSCRVAHTPALPRYVSLDSALLLPSIAVQRVSYLLRWLNATFLDSMAWYMRCDYALAYADPFARFYACHSKWFLVPCVTDTVSAARLWELCSCKQHVNK